MMYLLTGGKWVSPGRCSHRPNVEANDMYKTIMFSFCPSVDVDFQR
jgi:hypothetical protein